jgi:signal transduction histidine kinase/DNA-binding NarL/FixJ family response regulator
LDGDFCGVLELLPERDTFLLRAGVGWKEGLIGSATVGAGRDSQAGYTLLSSEPVIVSDLQTESRFSGPPLLHEHEVVSSASALIQGQDEPFGVLSINAKSRRAFTEDDANFLQAVANVLATAVQRDEAEEKLHEVREGERSRLARDLHDGALQDLTYALAQAQHVHSTSKDPEPDHRLEQVVEALKRTGQELRAAIHDLRLGAEQDNPFSELLESLVELHRRMVPNQEVYLKMEDGFPSSPLGKRDSELLRILKEALTNVRRHSNARHVRVGLRSKGNKLWAEVKDDGRGFDVSISPGLGLRSMRERAYALGGRLKIESECGHGTRVCLEMPLGQEEGQEPESEQEIGVLLVEDHVSFREVFASHFEREPGFSVVGQAGSLAAARGMLDGVDVAIIDLSLPDGYGGDLIKEMRDANPHAMALVLSAHFDRADTARAVESGAAAVLHKSVGIHEVVEAVRRLRAGESLLPLEEVVDLLRYAGTHREQERDARRAIAGLTPREREVIEALAEGLDGREIADKLNISLRTERNHMANILTKLGVHSRLQALVYALRYGVVEIH